MRAFVKMVVFGVLFCLDFVVYACSKLGFDLYFSDSGLNPVLCLINSSVIFVLFLSH